MSTSTHIPPSLIAKVRRAANDYRAAPGNSPSEPLEIYLAALESLAEYVTINWRAEKVVRLPGNRKPLARHQITGRILPFVAPSGRSGSPTPFPAA